jgi:predicted dehydrogenase
MQAMLAGGAVEAAAIADAASEMLEAAATLAPGAVRLRSADELLDLDLDGVVIATPSALHAEQAIAALERGMAVFCQKPLARTATETRRVIEAARRADRLLGVDFSYRFTDGMRRIRDLAAEGALGKLFAADLRFHNAYGPDKSWFYDPALSGGGCVMDLGVHLVDLALWVLDFAAVGAVTSSLVGLGERLGATTDQIEHFATATLELQTGAVVRLACSWRLHAGWDADISAAFYGTEGGAAWRNIDGSFYDFAAERFSGRSRAPISGPPDDWSGRAAADWARRLAAGERFDAAAERFLDVAAVLDRIYGR